MPLTTAHLKVRRNLGTPRRHGQMVFAMDQKPHGSCGNSWSMGRGRQQGGYCLGLSIQWLAMRKRARISITTNRQASAIPRLAGHHAAEYPCVGAPHWAMTFPGPWFSKSYATPIRAATLLIRYASFRVSVTVTNFHQILTGFPNTHWLIVLDAASRAALLMRWRRSMTRKAMHFFDPNYGHLTFLISRQNLVPGFPDREWLHKGLRGRAILLRGLNALHSKCLLVEAG